MTEPGASSGGGRLVSLDAYRGFVMLAMASAGLSLGTVATNYPESFVWHILDTQTEHAVWRGCSFWDLIQPSFMFLVGVAMPFSYAARRDRGDGFARQFAHALWRATALVVLGVLLSSAWSRQTNFVFANVLCQIGLGYPFIFLALRLQPPWQLALALAVLVGYGAWFATAPLPTRATNVVLIGGNFGGDDLPGFLAHWSKNTNPAAAFDRWFLNLFPHPAREPFRFDKGGYTTLNFVPSIATMLFGVLAGQWLRSGTSGRAKVQSLIIAAAFGLVVGMLLDAHVCPIVKRIWTPSWVIYSTGWTCGMLALFYGTIDVAGFRRWALPLVAVGANSIAVYVMAQLMKPWIASQLRIHLTTALQLAERGRLRWFPAATGWHVPGKPFQGEFGPVVESAAVLFAIWLIALWMYRRKIFIRL
jgi:heparan-alpha-glucosaminide N-acetyltransferase